MPDLRGPDRQPAFLGIPDLLHSPLALSPEELAGDASRCRHYRRAGGYGVVNRPGARFGPRAIRQAGYSGSPNDTFYHMEYELYPTQEIKVVDFGDANCPPSSLGRATRRASEDDAGASDGRDSLVLGGDHSITLPAATAVAQHHGYGRVGMIHFDAHADTGEADTAACSSRMAARCAACWNLGLFRGGTSYRSGCAGTGRTSRSANGCGNRGCAGT